MLKRDNVSNYISKHILNTPKHTLPPPAYLEVDMLYSSDEPKLKFAGEY